jgi:hypothetical protein
MNMGQEANSNEIIHVYNLYHLNMEVALSRPKVINFSTKKKMTKHITEMIMKCDRIDARFRNQLEPLAPTDGSGDWLRFIETFRMAQMHNSRNIGFDIYWDEEPQVLL